jgi:hypothetical protein
VSLARRSIENVYKHEWHQKRQLAKTISSPRLYMSHLKFSIFFSSGLKLSLHFEEKMNYKRNSNEELTQFPYGNVSI